MRKLIDLAKRFRREEDGAAMIEYTVLLGLITMAVIGTITLVGVWISNEWGELHTTLTTPAPDPGD